MKDLKASIDEIVFEGRNKTYGAYFLRKAYLSHIKKALAIVLSLLIIIYSGYAYINSSSHKVPVKQKEVVVDLTEVEIPPINPVIPPPPPPPVEQPKIKTVKYVPPKVVPDKEIPEETPVPTTDQIDSSAISNVTQEGKIDSLDSNPGKANNNTGGGGDNNLYIPTAGIQATFPGGQEAFTQYLQKGLRKAINKAARLGDKGAVFVYFIVEKDGSISHVKIQKGLAICTSCNDDAKKLIENMPKWESGKNNGNPVRLQYSVPIFFDFDE